MPSAPPSSEPVSEIPDAAPARSGGAEPTISSVVAMKTGDAATIAAPYTDDASFITIDGTCIQGRTEIEKMYRDRFARSGLARSTKINSKKLIVDDDLAYESGYGEIGLLKDGKLSINGGRFLTVWQRQANGDWKILRNVVLP